MTNDIVHFNVYCTTLKQKQISLYSRTILYNDNSSVNTSITGLLPNTTYTCCVLTITSYGESEPVCENITAKSTILMLKVSICCILLCTVHLAYVYF